MKETHDETPDERNLLSSSERSICFNIDKLLNLSFRFEQTREQPIVIEMKNLLTIHERFVH